jgi:FMN reductase
MTTLEGTGTTGGIQLAPRIVVVCGNPKPASRTLHTAVALAGWISATLPGSSVEDIDLATVAGEILVGPSPAVRAHLDTLQDAAVVIVATPVYKASFTGLLKAFLDLLPGGALRGAVAVPVTVSASAAHRLVADTQLRPVLIELGATTPTRAFAVDEGQLAGLDELLDAWIDEFGPTLGRLVAEAR